MSNYFRFCVDSRSRHLKMKIRKISYILATIDDSETIDNPATIFQENSTGNLNFLKTSRYTWLELEKLHLPKHLPRNRIREILDHLQTSAVLRDQHY